jgi:3D (Asp-Asp-Asp) domain-containing protein
MKDIKDMIVILICFSIIMSAMLYIMYEMMMRNDSLQLQVNILSHEVEISEAMLMEKHFELEALKEKRIRELTVTAYTPRRIETDNDPTTTASMTEVREGIVAVSRDLFENGWVFGRKVYIKGHGVFEIQDLMNERFEERMDIFMWSLNEARKFGKQQLKVALIN